MATKTDIQAYTFLLMVLKAHAPFDTGRLSNSGIRFEAMEDGHIAIGHDSDKTWADYAIYTEEAWVSPKWGGKQNPNEGWIEKAIESARPGIMQIYQGMSIEDFDEMMDEWQLKYVEHSRAKGGIKPEIADELRSV